jgi:spore coat protein JB
MIVSVGGMKMVERDCLMKEVMAVDFALIDLKLYLDTHPNDCKTIMVYNNCVKKYKELIEEYHERFGPIYSEFYTSPCPWKWIEMPWPWDDQWEMGGNV